MLLISMLIAGSSVSFCPLSVWVHQQQLNKHKNPPCSARSVKHTPRWPQVAVVFGSKARKLAACQHDSSTLSSLLSPLIKTSHNGPLTGWQQHSTTRRTTTRLSACHPLSNPRFLGFWRNPTTLPLYSTPVSVGILSFFTPRPAFTVNHISGFCIAVTSVRSGRSCSSCRYLSKTSWKSELSYAHSDSDSNSVLHRGGLHRVPNFVLNNWSKTLADCSYAAWSPDNLQSGQEVSSDRLTNE